MQNNTNPIPDGYTSVTPFLVSNDTEALLTFLEDAFGAETVNIARMPDGKIGHAISRIGNAQIMLSDAMGTPEAPPRTTIANTYLYVNDPDKIVETAKAAGAKILAPVEDMFWGDRWGVIEDPFGNRWQVAAHQKDVKYEDFNNLRSKSMSG